MVSVVCVVEDDVLPVEPVCAKASEPKLNTNSNANERLFFTDVISFAKVLSQLFNRYESNQLSKHLAYACELAFLLYEGNWATHVPSLIS